MFRRIRGHKIPISLKVKLLTLFFVQYVISSFAQTPRTNPSESGYLNAYEIGRIKFKVMDVISKFNYSYNLSGSDKSNFKSCFLNLDVNVTNDILYLNKLDESLSLKEYLDLRNDLGGSPQGGELLHFCNLLSFEAFTFDSSTNTGIISARVSRFIKWNKRKTGLISELSDTLVQKFHFIYQLEEVASDGKNNVNESSTKIKYFVKSVKISNIQNADKLGKYCFFLAEEISGLNYVPSKEVLVNGTLIKSQWDSVFFLKRILDTSLLVMSNNPELFNVSKLRLFELDKVSTVKFYPPDRELFFSVGTNLIGNRVFSNTGFDCTTGAQIHLNVGIGKCFYAGSGMRVKGRFSVFYSRIHVKSSLPNFSYMYNDLDPDNCRYNRITQLQNIQENGALNVLGFDGSIYASHMFSNKNSVYGEIGFRYTPRLKYNLESEAKAVYSGYYPDLYGLTISENGIYDFGSYSIVNSESKLIDSHLFSIGGGLGLSKNINRRFIMQAGIYCSYLMPFSFHRNSVPKSNISANKNELLSLFKFTETTGALVYYLNTGLIYQFYAKK